MSKNHMTTERDGMLTMSIPFTFRFPVKQVGSNKVIMEVNLGEGSPLVRVDLETLQRVYGLTDEQCDVIQDAALATVLRTMAIVE